MCEHALGVTNVSISVTCIKRTAFKLTLTLDLTVLCSAVSLETAARVKVTRFLKVNHNNDSNLHYELDGSLQ